MRYFYCSPGKEDEAKVWAKELDISEYEIITSEVIPSKFVYQVEFKLFDPAEGLSGGKDVPNKYVG